MVRLNYDKDGFLVGKGGKPVLENILDNTEQALAMLRPARVRVMRAQKPAIQTASTVRHHSNGKQASKQAVRLPLRPTHTVTVRAAAASSSTTSAAPLMRPSLRLDGKAAVAGRLKPAAEPLRDGSGRFIRKDQERAERSARKKADKENLLENKRQTRLLWKIFRKQEGGLLARMLKGLLGGAGMLATVLKSPGTLLKGGLKALRGGLFLGGKASGLGKLGRFGKVLGKGGLLAGVFAALQGYNIEKNEDLSRGQKNKEHVKNLLAAGGGVGGGALGAAIGTAILPGIGTVLGGVLGAALGSNITEAFTDWIETVLPEGMADTMFESWDNFTAASGVLWKNFTDRAASVFNSVWNSIRDAATYVWNKLVPVEVAAYYRMLGNWASEAWNSFSGLVAPYWESATKAASKAWAAVSDLASGFWKWARGIFGSVWTDVASMVSAMLKMIADSKIGQFFNISFQQAKGEEQESRRKYEQEQQMTAAQTPQQEQVVVQTASQAAERAADNTAQNVGNSTGNNLIARRIAEYAADHAAKKTLGKCARYVNNALRAQGYKVNGHGKDVVKNLLAKNSAAFEKVDYSKDYVPQDGDVMSIDHGRHQYGHVAVYNGRLGKWVSDFVQKNTIGNTAATNQGDYRKILTSKAKVSIARLKQQATPQRKGVMNRVAEAAQGAVTMVQDGANWLKDRLGSLVVHFESGNRGTHAISSGKGDKGGVSYGKYQMSSSMGVVQDFLKKSGFDKHFAGMQVNSAAFKKRWKELAKNKDFQKAEYEYIKKTHYDVQMRKLQKSGIDLSQRGKAVQDSIWSTSVQHGGSTGLIKSALKGKNIAAMSDADIIAAIQDYKISRVERSFKSSDANNKKGVLSRIKAEKALLIQAANQQSRFQTASNAVPPTHHKTPQPAAIKPPVQTIAASVSQPVKTLPVAAKTPKPAVAVNTPAAALPLRTAKPQAGNQAVADAAVAHRPIGRHVGNHQIAWIASGGLMGDQTA